MAPIIEITIEELKAKFPVQKFTLYGECIVVPGTEFDPDWEVDLADQGYNCINTDVDGKIVTLVHLRKQGSSDARVVHAGPAGPEPKTPQPKQVMPDPTDRWSSEENEKLIALWNQTPRLKKREIATHFPGRTPIAVHLRISRLVKKRKILERELIRKLRCHLIVEGKTTFTSDDFRLLGLDRFLFGDPGKAIGLIFFKVKENGIAEDTGGRVPSVIPSNHGREIKVYRWAEGA